MNARRLAYEYSNNEQWADLVKYSIMNLLWFLCTRTIKKRFICKSESDQINVLNFYWPLCVCTIHGGMRGLERSQAYNTMSRSNVQHAFNALAFAKLHPSNQSEMLLATTIPTCSIIIPLFLFSNNKRIFGKISHSFFHVQIRGMKRKIKRKCRTLFHCRGKKTAPHDGRMVPVFMPHTLVSDPHVLVHSWFSCRCSKRWIVRAPAIGRRYTWPAERLDEMFSHFCCHLCPRNERLHNLADEIPSNSFESSISSESNLTFK